MKRIDTKQEDFDALKPIYGYSKGNPPFYDPNDLHVHIWKNGKLGVEDDPKKPSYNKSKISIKDCVYCKVCHKINNDFKSTICNNNDINKIKNELKPIYYPRKYNYHEYITSNIKTLDDDINICVKTNDIYIKDVKDIKDNLFLKPDGIFDDYILLNYN